MARASKRSREDDGIMVLKKKRRLRSERACKLTAQEVRDQNLYGVWEHHDLPDNVYQCPRCQSYNTRFDYYNNEKSTGKRDQPRYACRSCKGKWTQGGKVRDVSLSPTGGNKRTLKSHGRDKITPVVQEEFVGESSQVMGDCVAGFDQTTYWEQGHGLGDCAQPLSHEAFDQNSCWELLPALGQGPVGDCVQKVFAQASELGDGVFADQVSQEFVGGVEGGDVQTNCWGQPQEFNDVFLDIEGFLADLPEIQAC
ncbi:hypothetical protein SELMODRAFT_417529 [Selaginella moellendorffii]|uniref:Dof-type domain-containing protein n=1 Tax=Selaginella moellendorffii TaxID=88036 RepID=D8S2R9_SELML|nr:hypothetical protein SELMODRAFT_417529 [Selaginella moellendorffii]